MSSDGAVDHERRGISKSAEDHVPECKVAVVVRVEASRLMQ